MFRALPESCDIDECSFNVTLCNPGVLPIHNYDNFMRITKACSVPVRARVARTTIYWRMKTIIASGSHVAGPEASGRADGDHAQKWR